MPGPTPSAPSSSHSAIERGAWLALIAALLGWLFDGLEMGLFPLVARPALEDLLGLSDEKQIGRWIGVITAGFLVGAATGGVLFGWLGDRIGRVRAMALSILTYALFTGCCGLAQSAAQVAGFRFIAALGMGGEWSLGVALVMELWPNRSRAWLAGVIGAAANVGYFVIALVGLGLGRNIDALRDWALGTSFPAAWTEALLAHSGWRFLMLVGATPALLTFLVRLFVPESARWEEERGRGATSHWATGDLGAVLLGLVGPGCIIYLWAVDHGWLSRLFGTLLGLVVAAAGFVYPVYRYLQRAGDARDARARSAEVGRLLRRMLLGAALGGVALLGTWGSIQWAPAWADQLAEAQAGHKVPEAKAYTQVASSSGAVLGTILGALVGGWLGRRWTYFGLCVLSLGAALWLFQANDTYGTPKFWGSVFLAGLTTAAFYGWLPLYLPELFPTRVRATGQGFSFNFGRILAAVGALQTGNLVAVFDGSYPRACAVTSLVYLVGMGLIWLAPETHGQPLPE